MKTWTCIYFALKPDQNHCPMPTKLRESLFSTFLPLWGKKKVIVETHTFLGGIIIKLETPWKVHCNSVSFGLRKRRKDAILLLAKYLPVSKYYCSITLYKAHWYNFITSDKRTKGSVTWKHLVTPTHLLTAVYCNCTRCRTNKQTDV